LVYSTGDITGPQTALVGLLVFWDVATHKVKTTVGVHAGGVLGFEFSADGQTLTSYGGKRELKLWDVATGKSRATLMVQSEGSVAAFSRDAKTLASGSDSGTIELREIPAWKNGGEKNDQDKGRSLNEHLIKRAVSAGLL
jgi:WD40 repeat protein